MRRGQNVTRSLIVCLGLVFTAALATAATPAEDLDRARALFGKGQYPEAREVLLNIDRDKLNDEQKNRRDELAGELETAINQSNLARQNLDDAEQALKGDDLKKAETLYRKVQGNIYASDEQKSRAREGLALIERQRELQQQLDKQKASTPPPAKAAVARRAPSTRPAPRDDAQLQSARKDAADLIKQGDEALSRGQYDTAEERFQAALRLVPNHPEALNGLELVTQHRAVEGRSGGIESVQRARRVRWQRAEALLRAAEQDIRADINAGRFEPARTRLSGIRQTLEAYRKDAEPADRYTYWNSQLTALGRRIDLEDKDTAERKARQDQIEVRKKANEQLLIDQKERTERIGQLMEQAIQYHKERQYDKAVDVLNEVLVIDPLYDRAQFMKQTIEDAGMVQIQKRMLRNKSKRMNEFETDASESLDPGLTGRGGTVTAYPDEDQWRMVTKRDPFGAGISGETEADRAARHKLAVLLPQVDLPEGTSFADAVEFIRVQGKVSITVNWAALGLIGVERTTDTGGLNLRDVKLETVLEILLDNITQAGGGTNRVAYDIVDGVVRISSEEDLNTRVIVRVYDIRDLLVRIRSFEAPNSGGGMGMMGGGMGMMGGMGGGMMGGMGGGMMGGMGGGMGGFGGGGGYGGGGGGEEDEGDESEDRRQEIIEDLEDLIMNNIQPGSWAPEGTQGSLDVWNDRLIVRHTANVHRQIVDLFRQLRASKDLTVAVEVRFLTLQSNFFEEIGIDLDIVLNNGNAGYDPAMAVDATGSSSIVRDPLTGVTLLQPRQFTRLGFTPAQTGYGQALAQVTDLDQPYQNVGLVPSGSPRNWFSRHTTPFPLVNNSLGLVQQLAQTHGTGVPGTLGASNAPAFQIFGSFLDNIQVDFLMRASQLDVHSSVLDAPRLVVFNGRSAYIEVTTMVYFVIAPGSLPTGGSGVGGQAAAGQQPTLGMLSRGRNMTITPYVSADRKYVTLEIYPQFSDVRLGSFVTPNGPIQVPEFDINRIHTYGTVPDGGTLLVGGLKQAGEVEVEAGVPVLSKIPALRRAFTNRNLQKDERVLLMLLKPKIIIQEEEEQMAFPSLSVSDRAGS